MNDQAWLDALRAGEFEHAWAPITVETDGHRLIVRVSVDAAKVRGVRESVTSAGQRALARALSAQLLTARLYEERWRQATCRVLPIPLDVVKATAAEHSKRIDLALANGVTGIVAEVGKTWIEDTKGRTVNHGFGVPEVATTFGPDRSRKFWRGIPTTPANAVKGMCLIQNRGAAHGPSHADYSQTALFVLDACELDGLPASLGAIYADPALCKFATHDGRPVSAQGALPFGLPPQSTSLAPSFTIHVPDVPDILFRQALHYTKGRRFGPPIWGVIHAAETIELETSAEALLAYGASASNPGASWTIAIDNNTATQSVKYEDTPWACPGANERGVHYELSGRAGQGADGWRDAYSLAVLGIAASIVRRDALKFGWPIRRLTVDEILAERPGLFGHNDGRLALIEAQRRDLKRAPWYDVGRGRWKSTTHTDPGPDFPWDEFLRAVKG